MPGDCFERLKSNLPWKKEQLLSVYFEAMGELAYCKIFEGDDDAKILDCDGLIELVNKLRIELSERSEDADRIRDGYINYSMFLIEQIETLHEQDLSVAIYPESGEEEAVFELIMKEFKGVLLQKGADLSFDNLEGSSQKWNDRMLLTFLNENLIALRRTGFNSYWDAVLFYGKMKFILANLQDSFLKTV